MDINAVSRKVTRELDASDYISNAEVASYLVIDESDALIPILLDSAIEIVENYCSITILKSDVVFIFNPPKNLFTTEVVRYRIGYPPTDSVEGVFKTENETEKEITEYSFIKNENTSSFLRLNENTDSRVKVAVKAGFDVDKFPFTLKSGILTLMSFLYENRGCVGHASVKQSGANVYIDRFMNRNIL